MSDSIKNIGVLLLVGGVLYFVYNMVSTSAPLGGESPVDATVLASAQAFIGYQSTLSAVDISLAVFNDERFTSLVSYSTTVGEQTIGKSNLFTE